MRNVRMLYFLLFIIGIFLVICVFYCKKDVNICNKPTIMEGMIPVYYDNVNKVWRKTNENNDGNKWYDYSQGRWANIVLVNENKQDKRLSKSRYDYVNAKDDTVILYSDILAFYVWIPRYKYELFNVDFDKIDETIINIKFENGTSSTGDVKCISNEDGVEECQNKRNGNWYTHPAFTFGSKELEGIWVGKFETTGSEIQPTILPNMVALTNQSVLQQFDTSKIFSSYVNSKNVDSHMMKNTEWGAVAYLSQSKYGRCNLECNEIYQNNSMGITGRSKGAVALGEGEEDNPYLTTYGNYTYDDRIVSENGTVLGYTNNNLGSRASTTGNITGIYDMSGGSNEYAMGTTIRLSNIDRKYYDLYPSSSSNESFERSKLGDATGEVRGFYGDKECLVDDNKPWSKRGCSSIGGEKSGLFYFCSIDGNAYNHISFRSVMVVNNE